MERSERDKKEGAFQSWGEDYLTMKAEMVGREESKGVGLDTENGNVPVAGVAGVALKSVHRKQER